MTSKRKTIFNTILLSLALLLCPPVLLAETTITAIDVGQGNAVLVQHQAYRVLIDGGGQPDTVSDYLTPAPGDSNPRPQEGELEILDSGLDVSAQVLELGRHGSRPLKAGTKN